MRFSELSSLAGLPSSRPEASPAVRFSTCNSSGVSGVRSSCEAMDMNSSRAWIASWAWENSRALSSASATR